MLTKHNVFHYLLERRIVRASEIMDGHVRVTYSSSRNELFRVSRQDGGDLALKQPRGDTPDAARTLWTEAMCYWLARQDNVEKLSQIVPELVDFDRGRSILVTKWVVATERISDHEAWTAVARALGSLHGEVSRAVWTGPAMRLFEARTPWIFGLSSPAFNYRSEAPAVARLIARVRSDREVTATLLRVAGGMRASALVHGDVKWPNVLFRASTGGSARAVLLDWEIAGLGDPLWDVAGCLASEWIFRRRLGDVDAFWDVYMDTVGLRADRAHALRAHLNRLLGARLLQSAFEAACVPDAPFAHVDEILDVARSFMVRSPRAMEDATR